MKTKNLTAFFVGSFDPVTRGHLGIFLKALSLYKKVIVGVGVNEDKKPIFSQQKRVCIFKEAIRDLTNDYSNKEINHQHFDDFEVEAINKIIQDSNCYDVVAYDGFTAYAALKHKAKVMIRGIRDENDKKQEMQLEAMNNHILHISRQEIPTHFIECPHPELANVSSSSVKRLCSSSAYIVVQRFVTTSVHLALMKYYLEKVFMSLAPVMGYDLKKEEDCKQLNQIYQLILDRSAQKRYHNLAHTAYGLNYGQIFRNQVGDFPDYDLFRLAFFFHDISDNESTSVEIGLNFFKNKFPKDLKTFNNLIMATQHLGVKPKVLKTIGEKLMHDVDLAILGDSDNYWSYVQKVKAENPLASPQQRLDVLLKFADNYPYKLPFFQKMFEKEYFENIRQEICFWQNK